MGKDPINALAAEIGEFFELSVRDKIASASFLESPIEAYFYAALLAAMFAHQEKSFLFHSIEEFQGKEAECRQSPVIIPQAHIREYRVDFLILVFGSDKWRGVVVECDGHDFHERTKEQAAKDRSRDRALQEDGYTVFRFTGSEIWRSPSECGLQAMTWIMSNRDPR